MHDGYTGTQCHTKPIFLHGTRNSKSGILNIQKNLRFPLRYWTGVHQVTSWQVTVTDASYWTDMRISDLRTKKTTVMVDGHIRQRTSRSLMCQRSNKILLVRTGFTFMWNERDLLAVERSENQIGGWPVATRKRMKSDFITDQHPIFKSCTTNVLVRVLYFPPFHSTPLVNICLSIA